MDVKNGFLITHTTTNALMPSLIIKETDELTKEELVDLNRLCRLAIPGLPENHLEVNHLHKKPTFYMVYEEGRMVAMIGLLCFFRDSPFSKKKIPLIYGCTSYKSPKTSKAVKGYMSRATLDFTKRRVGTFWPFKKILYAYQTCNPRVFERSSAMLPESYPSINQPVPKAVQLFVKEFIEEEIGLTEHEVDEYLFCRIMQEYDNTITIGLDWERMFKANNEAYNRFFEEHELVVFKEGQPYFTGYSLFFLGIHSFSGMLRKLFELQRFSKYFNAIFRNKVISKEKD